MKYIVLFLLILIGFQLQGQRVNKNVTIYRDSYGVPHIHGITDRDAAYGLAWAHAEDDFKTIQYTFLPAVGKMGLCSGKEGVIMDYLAALLRCRKTAENHYSDLSDEVLLVIEGYVNGINAYAKSHPEEVLVDNTFPMTVMDYLTGYNLVIHLFSDTGNILGELLGNKNITVQERDELMEQKTIGSNAFAFSREMMTNNKTVLNVNTHQPLEGAFSWYEAHVISEEGWNMLGGLFPGSPFPMIGTNENLGWTHTYNYPDLIDLYELKVNPKNLNQYMIDGNWIDFEKKKIKLKLKTKIGIRIGVKRKVLWSVFGPVIKNKKGFFAFNSNAFENISSIDQWYHMTKSNSWKEFEGALKMMAIPRFNVMYADREDSIFYMSLGKIPNRPSDELFHNDVMLGDTSALLTEGYLPFEALPNKMNPKHGYLFNTNNSPYNCAHPLDNPDSLLYEQYHLDYFENYNNRSRRFEELISNKEKLSMGEFFKIKYDIQYPQDIWTPSGASIIFNYKPEDFPNQKELAQIIHDWNHRADTMNVGAAQWAEYYRNYLSTKNEISDQEILVSKVLEKTQKHLMKYFGRIDIPLKVYQRHSRVGKELAVPGLTDMIAAMTSKVQKNGTVKPVHGESYIMIIQYDDNGVEVETVLPYGNSRRLDSPHYTDQMEMYARQERKKMSLKLDEVMNESIRSYHPGLIDE